jgi:translation elongation factor EF-1beta
VFTTHLKPKIKPNKTTINISDIRAQVKEGQRRWSEGLNIQSKDINKEEISEFIQYKIIKYGFHNITDDDLWELYREDFSTFTTEAFKNCN